MLALHCINIYNFKSSVQHIVCINSDFIYADRKKNLSPPNHVGSLRICVIQLTHWARAHTACLHSIFEWFERVLPTSALKRFKSLSRVLAHARKGYSILTNRIYIVKWKRASERVRERRNEKTEWKEEWINWMVHMQDASEKYKTEEKRVFVCVCVWWGTNGWLNKLNSMLTLVRMRYWSTPHQSIISNRKIMHARAKNRRQ